MPEMLGRTRGLIVAMMATACGLADGLDPGPPGPGNAVVSQGVVVGFVRDSAGQGVANAAVCAVAVFSMNGTPAIVVRQGVSTAGGAYVVPIDLTFKADARAGLTVAATPPANSGLGAAYTHSLDVLITTSLPPAETTQATVVVAPGTPSSSVFCTSGP